MALPIYTSLIDPLALQLLRFVDNILREKGYYHGRLPHHELLEVVIKAGVNPTSSRVYQCHLLEQSLHHEAVMKEVYNMILKSTDKWSEKYLQSNLQWAYGKLMYIPEHRFLANLPLARLKVGPSTLQPFGGMATSGVMEEIHLLRCLSGVQDTHHWTWPSSPEVCALYYLWMRAYAPWTP